MVRRFRRKISLKFLFLLLLISSCSSKKLCSSDLKEIADEDQADRKNFFQMSADDLSDLSARDANRREKVLELYRMGCINSAEDYKAAALVYQHGETTEDFLRSYNWSKKGIALGDSSQKSMMAASLDRYLVKSGIKQLFGTQATKASGSACWCLEPFEEKFTDTKRLEYTGKRIKDQHFWVNQLNAGKDCKILQCEKTLNSTPEEYIRGL